VTKFHKEQQQMLNSVHGMATKQFSFCLCMNLFAAAALENKNQDMKG
jgi:hypothetical protein